MHRGPDQQNACTCEGVFTKYNFNNKNINWDQVNHVLNEACWEDVLNDMDPNQCLERINFLVAEACSRHIPLRKKKSRSKLERKRRSLYRRRRRVTELLRSARTSDTRKEALTREVETIELKLNDSYRNQERQEELKAISEIERNSKYFFSYAKNKANTTSSIGPLLRQDGTYTDDNKEMSEILKSQYDSVFSEPLIGLRIDDPNDFFMNEPQNSINVCQISDITLTPIDFEKTIDNMPMHSAPGPDSWNSVHYGGGA
nr:uncharacterized protein LOC128687909 [Cherax quadricarinatus]